MTVDEIRENFDRSIEAAFDGFFVALANVFTDIFSPSFSDILFNAISGTPINFFGLWTKASKAFDDLLANVSAAIKLALVELPVAYKVDVPKYRDRVVTLDKAIVWAIDSAIGTAVKGADTSLPGIVQQSYWITSTSGFSKLWNILAGEKTVLNTVLGMFKRTFFVAWPLRAAALIQTIFGWAYFFFLLTFVRDILANVKNLPALPQGAPRKKRRLVGGGTIRRREPGGSKP